MDNFQEGQHQIANALDNCKSGLERALALYLISEIANHYFTLGIDLRRAYGKHYDNDITNLQNAMRSLMIECMANSDSNQIVDDIYDGFAKICNACLATYCKDRGLNGQI